MDKVGIQCIKGTTGRLTLLLMTEISQYQQQILYCLKSWTKWILRFHHTTTCPCFHITMKTNKTSHFTQSFPFHSKTYHCKTQVSIQKPLWTKLIYKTINVSTLFESVTSLENTHNNFLRVWQENPISDVWILWSLPF